VSVDSVDCSGNREDPCMVVLLISVTKPWVSPRLRFS